MAALFLLSSDAEKDCKNKKRTEMCMKIESLHEKMSLLHVNVNNSMFNYRSDFV